MKLKTLTFLLLFSATAFAQKQISKVWVADLGNGTYKNPVLDADYSDPDAIRVGEELKLAHFVIQNAVKDLTI